MRILILGDTGLLGQAIVRFAIKEKSEICGLSTSNTAFSSSHYVHKIVNLPDDEMILLKQINDWKPDWILNATAQVSIPFCESSPEAAVKINVDMPIVLAKWCFERKIFFTHISSDQVFDGKKTTSYLETDQTGPLNNYGRMKLGSEKGVLEANPDALIVRTNIIGFKGGTAATFLEWLIDSLEQKKAITLFENYVTSSIYVDLLAPLFFQCYQKSLRGIYHLASHDFLSKYAFGKKIANACGFDFSSVIKGRMNPLDFKPERPPFLALDVSKAESALGRRMPHSDEIIQAIASHYASLKRKTS